MKPTLWQVFRIGTVDVLRACDACADMRTPHSLFSIVQCTDSEVSPTLYSKESNADRYSVLAQFQY